MGKQLIQSLLLARLISFHRSSTLNAIIVIYLLSTNFCNVEPCLLMFSEYNFLKAFLVFEAATKLSISWIFFTLCILRFWMGWIFLMYQFNLSIWSMYFLEFIYVLCWNFGLGPVYFFTKLILVGQLISTCNSNKRN